MHDEPLFAGLKVIDAGSFIAAPAAATVMADLGADVIKLEPPAGDQFRRLRHAPGNPPCEVDYGWLADNRNKRGLVLDLKTEAGRGRPPPPHPGYGRLRHQPPPRRPGTARNRL